MDENKTEFQLKRKFEPDKNEQLENDSKRPKLNESSRSVRSNRNTNPAAVLFQQQFRPTVDIQSPQYRKPFKYGWKREFVTRANNDYKSKTCGEVYYYSPTGKKIKSLRDISEFLANQGKEKLPLTVDNFTYSRKPIGVGAEFEILRTAKPKMGQLNQNMSSPVQESLNVSKVNTTDKSNKSDSNKPKIKIKIGSSRFVSNSKNLSKNVPQENKLKNVTSQLNKNVIPQLQCILCQNVVPTSIPINVDSNFVCMNCQPKEYILENADESNNLIDSWSDSNYKIENILERHENNVLPMSHGIINGKRFIVVTKPLDLDDSKLSIVTVSPTNKNQICEEKSKRNEIQSNYSSDNFFSHIVIGYSTLLKIFHYLKVEDLMRASNVCKMWNGLANNRLLWRNVRMKNSKIGNFKSFFQCLKRHQTEVLDLRKVILSSRDLNETWREFIDNIYLADSLKTIYFCRCPSKILEELPNVKSNLECLYATIIKGDEINLTNFDKFNELVELKLKSIMGANIVNNSLNFSNLKNLNVLSFLSIKNLQNIDLSVLKDLDKLETLELGDCDCLPNDFGDKILIYLNNLVNLRLEKGPCNSDGLLNILNSLSNLNQLNRLELINFDIKPDFDLAIKNIKNLKKFMVIPTYISQTAATNQIILNTLLKINVDVFLWIVTAELLRVTEVFISKEKGNKSETKGKSENIPIMKPIPINSIEKYNQIDDNSKVIILSLSDLENELNRVFDNVSIKIVKVPFSNTWRQYLKDYFKK